MPERERVDQASHVGPVRVEVDQDGAETGRGLHDAVDRPPHQPLDDGDHEEVQLKVQYHLAVFDQQVTVARRAVRHQGPVSVGRSPIQNGAGLAWAAHHDTPSRFPEHKSRSARPPPGARAGYVSRSDRRRRTLPGRIGLEALQRARLTVKERPSQSRRRAPGQRFADSDEETR